MTKDRFSRALSQGDRRRRATLALLAALALAALPEPAPADVRVEAGGGVLIPYDQDHRSVYGSSPAFVLGASSAFGDQGARVFLDVAHVRGSGDELRFDPTFQSPAEATYRLWPITFGLRIDVNSIPDQHFRLFLEFGLRSVFTRWEGLDASSSSPTFGGLVGLRPEYLVGDRWSVWVRQRVDILRDVDYARPRGVLDYSGGTLELGCTFRLDDASSTPPRSEP
jgi:hypothetical protein